MEEYSNLIREIKKDFFKYRNGIIADSLKKLYGDGTVIFGLTVPQFMDLAKKYPKDLQLAIKLWEDKKNREARLFSLYLLPYSELEYEKAKEMFLDVQSFEEGDFLAFRILRHLPYAPKLYEELSDMTDQDKVFNYTLKMFKKNLDQI